MEDILSTLRRIELSALFRLRSAECTRQELSDIIDMMNFCLFSVFHQRKTLDTELIHELLNAAVNAGESAHSCVQRCERLGLDHYTCTGYELNAIFDGLQKSNTYLHDACEKRPNTSLYEHNASIILRDQALGGALPKLTPQRVERAYQAGIRASYN